MGREVILLFTKDQTNQPPAIIQDTTSGEYWPYHFNDWRDAVHFLRYARIHSVNRFLLFEEAYESWDREYQYQDKEEFDTSYNDLQDPEDVMTSIGDIEGHINLDTISAWTFEPEENNGRNQDTPPPYVSRDVYIH